MLSGRIFTFVKNQMRWTPKRSFVRPAGEGATNGLSLQVHRGDHEMGETLDFLEASFVQEEPIVKAFQIKDYCDLMRYIKHRLHTAHVVKLVNEDCEIISAAVCFPSTPHGVDEMRTFAECSICDAKTKRLLHFLADMYESHDLFECFKVKSIWDITYLATAAEGRGKGLGKIVVSEAKTVGRKEGFSICRMDCTSHYTAKLAQSLKFVTLPPRNSLTFRDKKGCPWLPQQPPHPHGNIVVAYDFLF